MLDVNMGASLTLLTVIVTVDVAVAWPSVTVTCSGKLVTVIVSKSRAAVVVTMPANDGNKIKKIV